MCGAIQMHSLALTCTVKVWSGSAVDPHAGCPRTCSLNLSRSWLQQRTAAGYSHCQDRPGKDHEGAMSLDKGVKNSTPYYCLSICHWVHLNCTDQGSSLMHWKISSTPYTRRQRTCFTAGAEGSECFIYIKPM